VSTSAVGPNPNLRRHWNCSTCSASRPAIQSSTSERASQSWWIACARGCTDLSILDLAATALAATRERIGYENVVTVEADVTTWHPTRHYDVWHDRAVLHFLSAPDALRYAGTLREALSPGGAVVIGVFAPDGPESCSGLPVTRYGAEDLAALLGEEFRIVTERRVRHRTPWGTDQSFQWVAARRNERAS
jgi:hypothetical protein